MRLKMLSEKVFVDVINKLSHFFLAALDIETQYFVYE